MIQIQQDMPSVGNLESIVNKYGETQMIIDTDSVKSDIEALEQKQSKPLSRIDKKNIKEVKEYLEKLLNKTVDSKLEIIWSVDNYILKTYPIELLHIPEYNIEMSDYISASEGHLVRVDFREVLEIIAIEMMYRDLDETMESMEQKLEHLGITGMHPASELLKHFEDNAVNLSKILKVGSSPYSVSDTKLSFEYFGTKEFKSNFYRDNVGYSIKHALAILTQAILDKLVTNNVNFNLCSVTTSGIYFIAQECDVDIYNILDEHADVRAFGRRFKVKSKVTIF